MTANPPPLQTKEVEMSTKDVGFRPSQATSVNTTEIYRKYGINIDAIKELKF
jgi:hypothetical protein